MTAPRNATSNGRGREYVWPSTGERFPSVTTILGALNKPALVGWGIKSVAEGAVARHDELAAMLASDGPDATIRWLKGLPYGDRDRAADLGSTVHAAIEGLILGSEVEWPTSTQAHRIQFDRFLAAYEPTFEASEATVYSRTHGYAGTLDFIASIGGRTYLGDVKTGKGVYDDVALQLAAYRYADFIGLPDGTEAPMPPVDGCVVLHLRPDGYVLHEVRADETTHRAFLYVREAWRWQNGGSDGAVGEMVMPVRLEVA
jgi:hypothetical protein